MPNPMTGAGYGDKKPKPSPKPNPKPTPKKKVKLGNVTTYKGSLYEKRQQAFLKKMQEMNKQSMKPKYSESQLPPRKG